MTGWGWLVIFLGCLVALWLLLRTGTQGRNTRSATAPLLSTDASRAVSRWAGWAALALALAAGAASLLFDGRVGLLLVPFVVLFGVGAATLHLIVRSRS